MVSMYFGLPGSGKTTLMTAFALKALKRKRYKHVFSNINLNIPGLIFIRNDDIGIFNLEDGLLLVDEATLWADSRDYKNFSFDTLSYVLQHRHYNVDLFLFTQQWDGVDRKIRVITDRVYYLYKGKILGHWFTSYYRIPYGIIIPDPSKKQSGEKLGEIVQGYCKPSLFYRLFFTKRFFRPKYYKYFDSWERPKLLDFPYFIVHEWLNS